MRTTASAIADKLRDRKHWFTLSASETNADILVRVLRLQRQRYMGSTYTPEPTAEEPPNMPMRPDIQEIVHLEAEIAIDDGVPQVFRTSGPRPKDAVSRLAKEIERRVSEH